MRNDLDFLLDRREFLRVCLTVSVPLVIAAGGQSRSPDEVAAAERTGQPSVDRKPGAAGRPLTPTPACEDEDDLTLASIEGPFYKPKSPERALLWERGVDGTRIVLTGQVLSRTCKPVPRALLDFWHADDKGDYDNVGFKLRGHQFADTESRYRLETIVPGEYGFRTRHFHVKVQAPNKIGRASCRERV